MTPIKAIREKCIDCMSGNMGEVKLCPIDDCSLYPFRFGKNPNIKPREYTDEQLETMRARGRELHVKQSMKKAQDAQGV